MDPSKIHMVNPIIAPAELATPVTTGDEGDVPDPAAPEVRAPAELPVVTLPDDDEEVPVLPGKVAVEVLFDLEEIPSPPFVVLTTAGQVRLKDGVVDRSDVIANLASLAGLESRRLYHQTLVLPNSWHPTVCQYF
ncbi:hypothetical protein EG327_006530 [Venturia inaequalis]|uniref:Uncharacterized protein n=2 Tax=Venturia inaequalis TaxID=5025 RepID=A0A8H3V3K8_VENIN|nr:hypothetical protein EG327_006530 [Venturia inaequalis]